MTRYADDRESYARRIQDEASRYVQELLGDNEALRILVSSLRTENQRLREQMALLREDQALNEMRHRRLEQQLAQVESDHETFSREHGRIEKRTAELTSLYVTSHRLHESLDPTEVCRAIEEIVASLVGSEEFALFERAADEGVLRLTYAVGVTPAEPRVRVGSGIVGEVAASGELWLAPQPPDAASEGAGPTACVPLRLGEHTTGVIAIFGLLDHKPRLEPADRELLEVLSRQAAAALFCARAHERRDTARAAG